MSNGKDKSGNYFRMGDGEQRKEQRQSRAELENLRSQFMDRARQFMDDTPLGEGRKAFQKFINKVQGIDAPEQDLDDDQLQAGPDDEEGWEGELVDENAPEAVTRYADPNADPDADDDFEDDDYDEPEDAELDWSRPEYIRAGYAKPGTKLEKAKSLEEAQEESFGLKMGNLSGLLSRFGSEDAEPETQTSAGPRHRMEMDKPLFRSQMDKLYTELGRQAGAEADPRLWLHPEVLTLLRAQNTAQRILLFCMAALFAGTDENYLTEADIYWIRELMERSGFLLDPKEIQRIVEQTFVFPERVHRLYDNLLAEPLQIAPEHFEQYRENLAKMYIYAVAARYEAEPRTVIRTLAAQWGEAAQGLQQALKAVTPIQEQYSRFQQKRMNSATMFQKLRQAEENVLDAYKRMQTIAREIEGLKQVTRLIQEEDALERLEQFRTEMVLEPEQLSENAISLYQLRERFVSSQLEALASQTVQTIQPEAVELSPVEQKHAIARAKEGEIKSLRLIETYKSWRLEQIDKGETEAPHPSPEGRPTPKPPQRPQFTPPARPSATTPPTQPTQEPHDEV